MDLEVLDLSHFNCGNESEQAHFAKRLVDTLTKHGFLRLINHGCSEGHIRELFAKV